MHKVRFVNVREAKTTVDEALVERVRQQTGLQDTAQTLPNDL
jgi:hypothetical protein